MQIFILGRTVQEQRRLAECAQRSLGVLEETLPIFAASPEALKLQAREPLEREDSLDGIPLSAYLDLPSATLFPDPSAAYREWRNWHQPANVIILGADNPDTFFSLVGHDEKNVVVWLEQPQLSDGDVLEDEEDVGPSPIATYLRWRTEAGLAIQHYRLCDDEYRAVVGETDHPATMYDGPSEEFFARWAA